MAFCGPWQDVITRTGAAKSDFVATLSDLYRLSWLVLELTLTIDRDKPVVPFFLRVGLQTLLKLNRD